MAENVNPDIPQPPVAVASSSAFKPMPSAQAAVTIKNMPDGTRVEYRADGTPARQWNPDGSVVTYDDQGRPAFETFPDGSTISFHSDGTATERLPDNTVVELDAHGKPVRETTPGGILFDSFDGRGRPLTANLPDGTHVRYEYLSNGDVRIRYSTGIVQQDDPQGNVRWERLSDGTTYTSFDSRGRPVGGTDPSGQAFTLSYDGQGHVVERFPDGSSVEADPGGRPIRQVSADGTVFTGFDGQGRPTRGVLPDGGGGFSLSYDADGDVVQHFPDGSSVETDPGGRPIRQVSADGTVFTKFDDKGRPTEGTSHDGTHFTITYDSDGDIFEHFDDGTVVEIDSDGKVIKTWTAEGVEIDWAVDLSALSEATNRISLERESIMTNFSYLKNAFINIEGFWDSPAGKTFPVLVEKFNMVTDSFITLLSDAIGRMRQTHSNIVDAETVNTNNLRPVTGGGGDDPPTNLDVSRALRKEAVIE